MGGYINDLYRFLDEVRINNNREWFAANRARYDALRTAWMEDLNRLIACMTPWEPGMSSQSASTASYRFYRDTRFSTDKSPYKTFFSALLSPEGRKTEKASYYLHVGPDPQTIAGTGIYGGIWNQPTRMLNKLRHAIVDNIEEFDEIINSPELRRHFPTWYGSRLKTMPQGWPKDHPQAELLRLKEYGLFSPADIKFFRDPAWPEAAAERMRLLKPLMDFINYSLFEEE